MGDYTIIENTASISPSNSSDKNVTTLESGEPERLMLYRSIVQETSRKITSSVSIDELIEMFNDIPSFKKKYRLINHYYNVLTKHIHDHLNNGVEQHITDSNLREKFERMEELIHDSSSKTDTVTWRPSHDIDHNLRSYFTEEKIKHRDQLKRLVSKKEDSVNKLKFEVKMARNRVNTVIDRLQSTDQQLESLCSEMQKLNEDDLIKVNQM